MEKVAFRVMKMGCSSCVQKVTKALTTVPGVEVLSVTPGLAVLNRSPDVSDATVIAALKNAGYDATKGEAS